MMLLYGIFNDAVAYYYYWLESPFIASWSVSYAVHIGNVDGRGTVLQAERSRVPVSMRSLKVFRLPNPFRRTMALGFAQPLTEMSMSMSMSMK
jgi:hypothetical protein